MNIYERLNVPVLINAAGTYTRLGGSKMPPEVTRAMEEAARSFVELERFQDAVYRRVAELTRNEAACVTPGAAAGLYLTLAACTQLKFDAWYPGCPAASEDRPNVVLFRAHRNPYDWAVRQLGLDLVEVGYPNVIEPPSARDLKSAINDRTVALLFVSASEWIAQGALSFPEVVKVCREREVPLVVDAAAQLPPVENLWAFTHDGADAVVFSGGKDLRGPQSTGLVLGRGEVVRACQRLNFPHYGPGRMLKVGREELAGVLAALERYLALDHEARRAWCEEQVEYVRKRLADAPGVDVTRSFPNEAGQPIPRARIRFVDSLRDVNEIVAAIQNGTPSIHVTADEASVYVNPMTLEEGETQVVAERLRAILQQTFQG